MDSAKHAPKFVFAHFMVGNTLPYTLDDWYEDISLAASQEIDGFVLNIGKEGWQKKCVANCFEASTRLSREVDFKFFFSFDMSSFPSQTVHDVLAITEYTASFGHHPRMFRYPPGNGVVISTFSGENSLFGHKSMEEGWEFVKREIEKTIPVHFIPSFFIDPARYQNISALNGVFHWNGGWPIHLNPKLPRKEIEFPRLDSDRDHLHHLGSKHTYMAAVSPWFFTHYGPESWNKNWIYRGDDWLFVRRWEKLIEMREQIDIVQVISWNDYGESHYIGPIKGAQPNSQAWVDGYPHTAWLRLNRFFAKAFKTGKAPHIQEDQLFLWARPHPREAIAHEHIPRPDNWQLTDDKIWAVVFLIAAATVQIFTTDTEHYSEELQAGMTMLSFPLRLNGGMRGNVIRDGNVVADCGAIGFRFESRPGVYNFNAFVSSS